MNRLIRSAGALGVLFAVSCRTPEPREQISSRRSALTLDFGQCSKKRVQVSVGALHSCALLSDHSVECWGGNAQGQLGNGTFTPAPAFATPAPVVNLAGVTQISAGESYTCALLLDKTVRCWGSNADGQLGNGGGSNSATPVPVSALTNVTALATGTGGNHTCALRSDGTVACWGAGDSGQLGQGTPTASPVPLTVPNLAGVTGVAAGAGHTCAAISDGTVQCWGRNDLGQLGIDPIGTNTSAPAPVPNFNGVIQIGTGERYSCALVTGGAVWCWGDNAYSQLGPGTGGITRTSTPTLVANTGVVSELFVGENDICIIVAGGTVKCWGDNLSSELGVANLGIGSATPVSPTGLGAVANISTSFSHTCAVQTDGSAWCWGGGDGGVLGAGATPPKSAVPVAVLSTGNFTIAGTLCRDSAGKCDSQEVCTGTSPDCPQDSFVAAGTACGDAPNNGCFTPPVCSGADPICPPPTPVPGCQLPGPPPPSIETTPITAEATGPAGANVSYASSVSAADFQGNPVPVDCIPADGTVFPLGSTTVNCTASDANGTNSAHFSVTVVDTTPPLITLQAVVTVPPTGPSGAQVVYATPTANDLVDGAVPVTCSPPSGSVFPLGQTTVTCVARDSRNNQATASFVVLVAKLGAGSPCTTLDACDSGHCIDGVCCEEDCGGGVNDCQACSRDAGSVGDDGKCLPVGDGRSCGTSGACRVAATCSPNSKVCPNDTPAPAGTLCDTPPNFCDWIQPICDQTTLACSAHVSWPANTCQTAGSTTDPINLGGGESSNGGVTVTPDAPLSSNGGTVSIAEQKLTQAPACPSDVPQGFKIGGQSQYWQIETSPPGLTIPGATVCFNYLPTALTVAQQCNLQLYHGDSATCSWGPSMGNDVCPTDGCMCGTNTSTTGATCSATSTSNPGVPCVISGLRSAGTICGHVDDHFSPFGLFVPEATDIPTVTVPGTMVVGATSATGAVVTFTASAHDAHDGDIAVKCTPTSGSKFPLGQTTVICSATDSNNLHGEASFTVWVKVQAPTDGSFFLQPINPDGSSVFKKGSTVPVKFRLTGVSAGITNLTARLLAAKVSNGVTGTSVEAVSTSAADAGNLFRFDPSCNQYIFNLSTKSLSTGTWSLRADLGDRVDHVIDVSLR